MTPNLSFPLFVLLGCLAAPPLVSAGLREESVPVEESGWLYSDWFGYYYPLEVSNNAGWVYVDERGWFYADENSGQLWMWSEASDWIWVDEGWYPLVYLAEGGYYQDIGAWDRAAGGPADAPVISPHPLNSPTERYLDGYLEGDPNGDWIAYMWDGQSFTAFYFDHTNVRYDPPSGIPANPQVGDRYSVSSRVPFVYGSDPHNATFVTDRSQFTWTGLQWELVTFEPIPLAGAVGDVIDLEGQLINRNTDSPILLSPNDRVEIIDGGVRVSVPNATTLSWTVDGQTFSLSSLRGESFADVPTDVPAGTQLGVNGIHQAYVGFDLDNLTLLPTARISGSPPGYYQGGFRFDGTEWVFIGGGG